MALVVRKLHEYFSFFSPPGSIRHPSLFYACLTTSYAMEIPRRNLQHPALTPKLLAANLSLADTAGLAVVWA